MSTLRELYDRGYLRGTHMPECKPIEYCAGFYFNPYFSEVYLIKKNKPYWQAGKWNAIGGKIEKGETPSVAQSREFLEETGVMIPEYDWTPKLVLSGFMADDATTPFKVHFFYASGDKRPTTATSEEVRRFRVEEVLEGEIVTIPNLHWIIPMIIAEQYGDYTKYEVVED